MTLVLNDRYALRRLLGGGGMGVVYLAQDLRESGMPVALKSFAPGLTHLEYGSHLQREFQLLSELAHPHIVAAYDFAYVRHVMGEPLEGEPAEPPAIGSPFFTREFVSGIELHQAVPRNPLPVLLRLMLELTGTVAYLHRQGILHRDLKPDNIFVTGQGSSQRQPRVKLHDFGLAAYESSQPEAVGALRYLAPELLHGSPVDTRAELYSLGLILFELLTGTPALEADSAAELARLHATQGVRPLPMEFPGPLRDLVADLLRREPSLRPTAEGMLARLEVLLPLEERQGSHALTLLGGTRLVGREAEVSRIDRAVREIAVFHPGHPPSSEAEGGPPSAGIELIPPPDLTGPEAPLVPPERPTRAVFLTGPPGIGKTRLARLLTTRARLAGLRVMSTTCLPDGDAFSAARSLLRPLLLERPDLITPEREVLRTVLLARPHGRPEPRQSDLSPRAAMVRILDATRSLLADSARELPLVLCIEDLHRVDPESLELFRHLLLHLPIGSLLLVASSWPSATDGAPIDVLSSDLPTRLGAVEWLELEGLEGAALGALLTRMAGISTPPEPLIEKLKAQTEGNPLFIEEILRLAGTETALEQLLEHAHLPTAVAEAFGRQLEALTESAQKALRGLAVWGGPASSADIADLTRQDRAECLEALEQAVAAQLLREQGNGYWFWHAVMVQLVEATLAPIERMEYHRRAGQRREASGELLDPDRLSRLVLHFTRAGDAARALGYALTGARLAEERFLARRAIELYEKALGLSLEVVGRNVGGMAGMIEVRERLAELYAWTGDYDKAERQARDLLEHPWLQADATGRTRLQSLLGEIATRRGEFDIALQRFQSALQSCPDPQVAAGLLDRSAEAQLRKGDVEAALASSEAALKRLGSVEAPVLRASIRFHQGKCAQQTGAFQRALERFGEARALYARVNHQPGVAAIFNATAQVYTYLNQYESARAALLEALHLQEQLGDVEGVANTLDRLALATWGLVDTDAAIAYVKRSLEAWRRLGSTQGEARAVTTLGLIYHSRGHYREAFQYAQEAFRIYQRAADIPGLVTSYLNIGILFCEVGAEEQAWEAVEAALDQARRLGSRPREARCHHILGVVAGLKGDLSSSRRHLELALEVFKDLGNKELLSDLYCAFVDLELKEGDHRAALEHARASVELVSSMARIPLVIQAHLAMARVLLARGSDIREVMAELEGADASANDSNSPDLIWQLWEVRGRLAQRAGRPREACRLLARSLEVIKGCYSQLPDELKSLYINDPRRQAVRRALEEALTIART